MSDFTRFIKYDSSSYLADFNTLMYNQLLEQAKHNEQIKIKTLDAKLVEFGGKAWECYKKINSEVDSDEVVFKNFIELII